MLKHLLKFRRFILMYIIPEKFWPKSVYMNGLRVEVRNKPYSFGTKYALCKNTYEYNERKLLLHRLFEGDVIYEFGGSVGILTGLMSNLVGETGYIVSVEASDKLSKIAEYSFRDFKNVCILNGFGFPVFSLQKTVTIIDFNEEDGSLGGKVDFTLSDIQEQQKPVKIYDVKAINEFTGLEPSILVIDIEGSEIIFKEQVPAFPLSVRLLLIEFHPHIYNEYEMNYLIDIIKSESFDFVEKSDSVYLFKRKNNIH